MNAVRHEFQFRFDVPFIKAALRRDILWRGHLVAGLLLVMAVVMRWLAGRWDPWLTGAPLLAAALVVWRFHAMLDKIARRVHELWSRQSPAGVIRWELDDDGFEVVLEHGRSRHAWRGLRRLWRYDDAWLVEIVRMQSVFFPPDQASEEAREFIVERCRAAGVRV